MRLAWAFTPLVTVVLSALPVASVAQVERDTLIIGGIQRNYIIFVPKSYDRSSPFPLVFNLHGNTLSGDQQMNYSRMNLVADTAGFFVVYPNAVDPGWNCGIRGGASVDDVGFFSALIDTLSQRYRIDVDRIYSCGFSLGGFMSYRLACQLSQRITAVASVAGTMATAVYNGVNPMHTMPVLSVHGTADEIVRWNGEDNWCSVEVTLNHWTAFNRCVRSDTMMLPDVNVSDGCTVARMSFIDGSGSSSVVFFKVINGGHSWPLGDKQFLSLSWGNVGTTNEDFNASEEIWKFFKAFHLSGFTSIASPSLRPTQCMLSQNYPNPFNPSTTITYELPRRSYVTLTLFNTLGQKVAELVKGDIDAGYHEVLFNASTLASGIYFYRLQAGGFVQTRSLLVLR